MWQTEVVVQVVQGQLLAYPHLAFARGRHPPANGGHMLADGEVDALAKVLAIELAPVRVNLIAPSFVDTPLSAALLGDQLDQRREQLGARLPIGRVVGPADVAALAVHLMTNTAVTARLTTSTAASNWSKPDTAGRRSASWTCPAVMPTA
jgi:NAD(P)-dependent dehydrogenase (short-subunit alcohol dehydrogenase family)